MQAVDGQVMQHEAEGTKIGGFAAGFFGGLLGALLVHFLAKSPITKKFGWIGFGVGMVVAIGLVVLLVIIAAAATTTA